MTETPEFRLSEARTLLANTPDTISALLTGLAYKWVIGRSSDESWNPIEIVAHLIHGEKTDWLTRTKIILSDGEKRFEPFQREAGFGGLSAGDLPGLLDEFRQLRLENLNELDDLELGAEDLLKIGLHPEFGEVTLMQLLAAWVVHDLGHIRQISQSLAMRYKDEVGPWGQYLTIVNE